MKIALIGSGKMGNAFVKQLETIDNEIVRVKKEDSLEEKLTNAELIILAVKPWVLEEVLRNLADLKNLFAKNTPVILSVVAGKTLSFYQEILDKNAKIVRTMPNLPVSSGSGVVGLCSVNLTETEVNGIVRFLKPLGLVVPLPEEQIDSLTAISGSGPAYFYYFVDALKLAGEKIGLNSEIALKLAKQTAFGAGVTLKDSEKTPNELIADVATKGGTTAKAIEVFSESDFNSVVEQAVTSCFEQAKNL